MRKVNFGSEKLKLKIDEIELTCYILDDGERIFLREEIPKTMGYNGKSEDWLSDFLNHIDRFTKVDPLLIADIKKDVFFEILNSKGLSILKRGISPNVLILFCNAIQQAKDEGFLYLSELKFAKAAEKITLAHEQHGIIKLIDHATGFELYRQNHKDALVRFLLKNDQNYGFWIKTFPDTFFEMIFLINNWDWTDLNKSGSVANYFNDIIFSRISPADLKQLAETNPKMKYKKQNVPEKYLEHPLLQARLQGLEAILKATQTDKPTFQMFLDKMYPRQTAISFIKAETELQNPKLQNFNIHLKKMIDR